MRVTCDAGGCCAIKIIRDLYAEPDSLIPIHISKGHDEDTYTTMPDFQVNWAKIEIKDPEIIAINAGDDRTKAADLFRFYVNQIKYRRPEGMIIVNLAAEAEDCGDFECSYCDCERSWDTNHVDRWDPILRAEGFTCRTFINSNSGSMIYHYTLVYGD